MYNQVTLQAQINYINKALTQEKLFGDNKLYLEHNALGYSLSLQDINNSTYKGTFSAGRRTAREMANYLEGLQRMFEICVNKFHSSI